MDIALLVAIATFTLIAIISVGYFFNSKTVKVEVENRAVPRPRNAGLPRRAQAVRNRGVRQRGRMQIDASDDEEDAEDVESPTELDEKMGAKKRAKLEAKAEKKAQREAEEHQRQEKKKREQEAEKERRLIEDKQRVEDKRLEEEEKKAKEDKERKEYEEYLKMKEAFSVEEEGFEEEGCGDESQNLLQEFINFIKINKVVVIEDLAAHFKLKTQAAIDRIQDLLNDNILTGVIDDRGKFIYVSLQEMEEVAKFIKQRGRVSISELAENSNRLINLTPTSIVE